MRDSKGLGLRVATGCWLTFAWALLWGNPSSLGTWVAGIGIAFLVMLVFPLPRRQVIGTLHLFDAIRLVLYVLGQVTISSIEVGTSGKAGERASVVTASAFTVPDWMFFVCTGTPSIIMATRPVIRSGIAAIVPR